MEILSFGLHALWITPRFGWSIPGGQLKTKLLESFAADATRLAVFRRMAQNLVNMMIWRTMNGRSRALRREEGLQCCLHHCFARHVGVKD